MAAVLLPEALWELIDPLLPTRPSRPNGGRPCISDRARLTGILFVLRSGIPWQTASRSTTTTARPLIRYEGSIVRKHSFRPAFTEIVV
jgi:transposase